MNRAPVSSARLAFGRFLVLPHRREVLVDGLPLRLGGRAYDVLMTLIEAHGAVVSKDTLMARVWPERAVEENALEAQISTVARGIRSGPRADPDGLWTRLPVHRRDPRVTGERRWTHR